MNLHQAEFIAVELIAFYLGVTAIGAVWRQYLKQQERQQARDWPEHGETTEFSSTQDD